MRIDYRELKQQIRLLDLLTRIGWKSIEGRGDQLRGPCPLPACSSQSATPRPANDRALSINTAKNVYRCFHCRSSGNALDFWRTYRATNVHAAAVELCQILETGNHTPF